MTHHPQHKPLCPASQPCHQLEREQAGGQDQHEQPEAFEGGHLPSSSIGRSMITTLGYTPRSDDGCRLHVMSCARSRIAASPQVAKQPQTRPITSDKMSMLVICAPIQSSLGPSTARPSPG